MKKTETSKCPMIILAFFVALLSGASHATGQSSPQPPTGAKAFPSPKAAADVIVQAAAEHDVSTLLEILGPDGKDLVSSKDPTEDKNDAVPFVAAARQAMAFDTSLPNRAILLVGPKQGPLPIPIVKRAGKWYFDAKAGSDEIIYRRIGENELDVIQVCRGYVEAQSEYASQIHDDSGVNQYAQKAISTPGRQDGLYWENANGTAAGPIDEVAAKAIAAGFAADKPSAFHGYYFKILKGQGAEAPRGQIDYVIEGVMIGGFALVAVPAEYKVTGVKTFMVSHDGIVYQKDLGPDSAEIGSKIELYNPDKTWQPTSDKWASQNR